MLLISLLAATFVLVAWTYFDTYAAIVAKWRGDAAYSHGFLILPISLWLVWRTRAVLAQVDFGPSALGALVVLACTLSWIVARGSGVLVLEQFAAVALMPGLVLTALGWPATRVLLVPLGFMFFMVPFGRGLVPLLMQATAEFSTLLLQWTGVPVYRTHMYISIPNGNFEVARACSGLNYFTTSMVLGVLYAYLNFRSWPKRIACVAAFVVIPIVANVLRVYFTILVSHLTQMRYGPGTEHVTFGRVFFIVVVMALFWIGRRWHDDRSAPSRHAVRPARGMTRQLRTWWPLPLACMVALAGPAFAARSVARAAAHLSKPERLVLLPDAAHDWTGPHKVLGRWRPRYRGSIFERQAFYSTPDGKPLDVFIAVYGLGTNGGAEMISYNNVLVPEEIGSLAQDARRRITTQDGDAFRVREVVLGYKESRQLVWQWYVVGERPVLGHFATKALEAVAFIMRSADTERIVTLATPLDSQSRARLQGFIDTYGHCAVTGFPYEVCDK